VAEGLRFTVRSPTVSERIQGFGESSAAPQKLMRRVERSEDGFELRVVRGDDDIGRVEAEPLPPICLEPIRAFGADQREHAAGSSRPLELTDCVRIGWDARAGHGELSPTVHNRERIEEAGAYVGTRASAGKNSSQPGGRLHADELSRSRAEIRGEAATARGHLENPPAIDLELGEDSRVNGLGLADGVPELWLELIHHRPEQGSTETLGRLRFAAGGRRAFGGGDASQVLRRQPSNIVEAVALPARRSLGSSLEVIHFWID